MEISKKISKWAELKDKIWPNSTTEDKVNEAPFTWSVLPPENWMMKIKNFHRAVESNNAVFAGFKHRNFDGL